MTVIRAELVLSQSAFSHVIDVPFERVDIAKWLFSLPDAGSCRPIGVGSLWVSLNNSLSAARCGKSSGLVLPRIRSYCAAVSLSPGRSA